MFFFVCFSPRNLAVVQAFTLVHSFYLSWHADSPFAVRGFISEKQSESETRIKR